MKQYTSKDQTAKLIELGFRSPVGVGYNYSIGELIDFLPTTFSKKDKYFHLDIFPAWTGWIILYETYNKEEYHRNFQRELIDALFCACVTLKEEGVI